MKVDCPFCSGSTTPAFKRGSRPYYRCRDCRLLFAHPGFEQNTANYSARFPEEWRGTGREGIYEEVLDHLPASASGRLLDVGCGGGGLMAMAALRGWDVWGVDSASGPDTWTHDDLRHRIVCKVDQLAPKSFDAVSMINVLDQVSEPWRLLAQVAGLMHEGATLILRLPNARLYKFLYQVSTALPGGLRQRMQGLMIMHDFGMERLFLQTLLGQSGFHRIRLFAGCMSRGDIYGQGPRYALGKRLAETVLRIPCQLSGGHLLFSPSVLVTASKR